MCTAITYRTRDFYFGRTLDYECGYAEEITVTPRGYLGNRYALLGMAYVEEEYPLYYDAANEAGLCMAGLNFVQNAYYQSGDGVAPHELIPRVLGACATVAQARKMLDEAGYPDCGIVASNSLDEYIIRDMLLQGAKIDSFGVGERLITSKSTPVFGGVYKLSAIA